MSTAALKALQAELASAERRRQRQAVVKQRTGTSGDLSRGVGTGVTVGSGRVNTYSQPSSSSGRGGGSSPAPAPSRSTERYWWQPDWRDSAYNQQMAAINRALADFETELGLTGERYGTDYLTGVRKLGYRPGEKFSANIDIFSLPGIAKEGSTGATGLEAVRSAIGAENGPMQRLGSAGGRWDYEGEFDPFTAAARGTRTARDEFAGRGMLRSSDFAKSYADFQDRMTEQLESMERGRARFYEDAAMDLAQRRSEAEERRQAARVNAMARAAAAGEYRTR